MSDFDRYIEELSLDPRWGLAPYTLQPRQQASKGGGKMSGGSYDYAFQRIDRLAGEIRENHQVSPLHCAFAGLLERCAVAARAVEWADSNDCSQDDALAALRLVVTPQDVLPHATEQAERALQALTEALEALKETR